MTLDLPEIRPEERTPLVEALLALLRQVLDRAQQLEEANQQLRDEIARLQGQQSRPTIRPSVLESAPPVPPPEQPQQQRPKKRAKNCDLTIHHKVPAPPPDLPPGAVFKGYEPYVVQELKIACEVTRYWRARYDLPAGGSVLAPLPPTVLPGCHFGPTL